MPKVILFDADGVVLKKYKEYFSDKFAREQDVKSEGLDKFFKERFKLCQTGEADIKEELEPVLAAAGWEKGAQGFLDLWFATDVVIDSEVLAFVSECRAKGAKVYLSSDQEKYRGAYLWGVLGTHFDGHFFSHELGATKAEPQFFEKALRTLNLPASDAAYTDDDPKNVAVGESLGIRSHFFTNLNDLRTWLS